MREERDFSDFTLLLFKTGELPAQHLEAVHALFDGAYRQANHAYLRKSLARLSNLAIAYAGAAPAGFALGEMRIMDLPRLPGQIVSLAGICCVDSRYRRRGLFGKLENMALSASRIPAGERVLSCGRMAHPASMRSMSRNPSVVPKPSVCPTEWQREVGKAIADAYGVHGFDPETFVCLGAGEPIGYPVIDIEAEPGEWEVFKPVNRDRGDALLAIAWNPTAPPGWATS